MICTCGHHMGAHRPFCRDCDFNTAGCRQFKLDPDETLRRMSSGGGPRPARTVSPHVLPAYQQLLSVDPDRRCELLEGSWDTRLGSLDFRNSSGQHVLLSDPDGRFCFGADDEDTP